MGHKHIEREIQNIYFRGYKRIRLEIPFHIECKGCGKIYPRGKKINGYKNSMDLFEKQGLRLFLKCSGCNMYFSLLFLDGEFMTNNGCRRVLHEQVQNFRYEKKIYEEFELEFSKLSSTYPGDILEAIDTGKSVEEIAMERLQKYLCKKF